MDGTLGSEEMQTGVASALDYAENSSALDYGARRLKVYRTSFGQGSPYGPARETGYCNGSVIDGPDVEREISRRWGGGSYELRGPKGGQTTVEIPGPSKPIRQLTEEELEEQEAREMEALPQAQPSPGFPGYPPGYPTGWPQQGVPGHYPQQVLLPPGGMTMQAALQQQQAQFGRQGQEEAREWKAKAERLQDRVEQLQGELARQETAALRAADALERAKQEHQRELESLRERAKQDAAMAELRARLDSKPAGPDPTIEMLKLQLQGQKEAERTQRELMTAMLGKDPMDAAIKLAQLTSGKQKDSLSQVRELLEVTEMVRQGGGSDESEWLTAIKAAAQGLGGLGGGGAGQPAQNTQTNPGGDAQQQTTGGQQAAGALTTMGDDDVTRWGKTLSAVLQFQQDGMDPPDAAKVVIGFASQWGKPFVAELVNRFANADVAELASTVEGYVNNPLLPAVIAQPAGQLSQVLKEEQGRAWIELFLAQFRQTAQEAGQ